MTQQNETELCIKDVGDTVYDVIGEAFDSAVEEAQTPTHIEYAPYGDTYAAVDEYISDDDEIEVRENFEQGFTFEDVIERLKSDDYFKRAVMSMIEHVAWNRSF